MGNKTYRMRRILLSLIAILCISMGYAQNKFNLSEVKSLTNYGIDFTIAKVYGGKDTGHQYWSTYADINELFIMKPKCTASTIVWVFRWMLPHWKP